MNRGIQALNNGKQYTQKIHHEHFQEQNMKLTGVCERNPEGVRHRETTRDERIRIVTLRDDAGWSWTKIGQHLHIDRRTCQKVSSLSDLNSVKKVS